MVRAWIQGGTEDPPTSSVFLEAKKETGEDVYYSSLQDCELLLASSILKLLFEGAPSITIQSAPEADLVV